MIPIVELFLFFCSYAALKESVDQVLYVIGYVLHHLSSVLKQPLHPSGVKKNSTLVLKENLQHLFHCES